jgi:hypothetical protein
MRARPDRVGACAWYQDLPCVYEMLQEISRELKEIELSIQRRSCIRIRFSENKANLVIVFHAFGAQVF